MHPLSSFSDPLHSILVINHKCLTLFKSKNVYIADGKMQDGAFAKRDLKKGDLVLYYSGIIYNSTIYNEMVGFHNSSAYERCSIKVSCTTTNLISLLLSKDMLHVETKYLFQWILMAPN